VEPGRGRRGRRAQLAAACRSVRWQLPAQPAPIRWPTASKDTEGRIGRATRGCVGGKSGFDQLIRVFTLKRELGNLDLDDKPRWGDLLKDNSVGTQFRGTPLFVVSATADKLIADNVTKSFVEKVKDDGAEVTFVPIEGGDHGTTAIETSRQAIDWIASRFAAAPRPQVQP
jgi:acetyl esterase/lipase